MWKTGLLENRNGQGTSKPLDHDLKLWFIPNGSNSNFLTVNVLLVNRFFGNKLLILQIPILVSATARERLKARKICNIMNDLEISLEA